MATPTTQFNGTLEEMNVALKTLWAKLQAHQHTVHELLNANLELRAALHMAQGTAPVTSADVSPVEVPATDETALTSKVETSETDTTLNANPV